MSFDINNVTLVGRLTRDPESGFTQNNTQYTKFSIASNNGKKDDPNAVNYFDITTWNKTAEICSQYLKKGSQVVINGRLNQSRFTTKEGQNRSKIDIVANSVQFVGGRAENQSGWQPGGNTQQMPAQNQNPHNQGQPSGQGFNQTPNQGGYPPPQSGGGIYPPDGDNFMVPGEDDIPF